MQGLNELGRIASDATILGAIDYIRANHLKVDRRTLTETCRSMAKARIMGALADAKAAIEAGMDKVASATFVASMRLAGIEAAKEASVHPTEYVPVEFLIA